MSLKGVIDLFLNVFGSPWHGRCAQPSQSISAQYVQKYRIIERWWVVSSISLRNLLTESASFGVPDSNQSI